MYRIPYELAATVQADREREARKHRFLKSATAGRQNRILNPVLILASIVRSVAQQKPPAVSEPTTRFSST